jgi:hypothetical protein
MAKCVVSWFSRKRSQSSVERSKNLWGNYRNATVQLSDSAHVAQIAQLQYEAAIMTSSIEGLISVTYGSYPFMSQTFSKSDVWRRNLAGGIG